MIWEFSLPGPRIVEVWRCRYASASENPRVTCSNTPPSALYTCHESRKIAKRAYSSALGKHLPLNKLWINPKIDTICLNMMPKEAVEVSPYLGDFERVTILWSCCKWRRGSPHDWTEDLAREVLALGSMKQLMILPSCEAGRRGRHGRGGEQPVHSSGQLKDGIITLHGVIGFEDTVLSNGALALFQNVEKDMREDNPDMQNVTMKTMVMGLRQRYREHVYGSRPRYISLREVPKTRRKRVCY